MKIKFVLLRVIGILLIIGLLAGGGFAAYRYGYSQGVAQSPAVVEALKQYQQADSAAPFFHHGFDGRFMPDAGRFAMRGGGHFEFGGLLGLLFAALLIVGLVRLLFGPTWAWRHGPWAQSTPATPASAPQPEAPADENK